VPVVQYSVLYYRYFFNLVDTLFKINSFFVIFIRLH